MIAVRASRTDTHVSRGRTLVDDRGSAHDADAVAERRGNDARGHGGRLHRAGAHALANRREQLLTRPCHAASDDHDLGLEEVHDRGDPAGERLDRLVPDGDRDRVAGARRGR